MQGSSFVLNEAKISLWVKFCWDDFRILTGTAERADDLERAVGRRLEKRLKKGGLRGLLNLSSIVHSQVENLSREKWTGQEAPSFERPEYKQKLDEIEYAVNAMLIDEWIRGILPFFRRHCVNLDAAEELSGQVRTKLIDALYRGCLKRVKIKDRLKPVRRVEALIKTAAKRKNRDEWRKDGNLYGQGLDDESESLQSLKKAKGGRIMGQELDMIDVRRTIATKVSKDARPILYDWVLGYTRKETAERYGITIEEVDRRRQEAFSVLRRELRKKIVKRSEKTARPAQTDLQNKKAA